MIPIGMKFKPVKQLILTEFSEKKKQQQQQHNIKEKQKQLTAEGQIFH